MRPDDTGLRGGKPGLRSQPKVSPDEFPYDRDRPVAGFHGQITPKDTDHSVWDEIEETIGIPFSVSQSQKGNNGAGPPGSNKGWASMPSKPWDDDSKFDEDWSPLSIDQRVPPAGDKIANPPTYNDMRPVSGVDVDAPVDLSMTIITVARDLLAPGSTWSELISRLGELNISTRKGT